MQNDRLQKLLKELFEKYDEELALALDGNIEQYCYKEIYTKEYGTNDANYKNRLRLSYAIYILINMRNILELMA